MKHTMKAALPLLLILVCLLSLTACTNTDAVKKDGLWEDAVYLQDTEFGSGSKTAVVEVSVEDQIVTFTVHTDADTVGAALLEHELIDGEEGAYGLYVKVVNGITADYDVDKSYWAFYVDGEYASTGVDTTQIAENAVYRLEYTK